MNTALARKNELNRVSIVPFSLAVILLCCLSSIAQDTDTKLEMGVPDSSQIVNKQPASYSLKLSANQTARILVEQTGMDVSIVSYDTDGAKLLE